MHTVLLRPMYGSFARRVIRAEPGVCGLWTTSTTAAFSVCHVDYRSVGADTPFWVPPIFWNRPMSLRNSVDFRHE
ncbi:hypothetical protein Cob_v011247 [Colletotrichum orbiculare MAFF 240422]|uniref:Uncharacterized protein n=1 Tax=Colletotrichum orbiculare (strain 104-T / ATCC 96160 / CBS 514.97 / LARS 414 / MAFF 240422) TaxID=1213857 RepID=A0A484FC20_COLOR|nr:hypothetical protein Cob_v011247 [Colletotrichum orbiculare MAFF 240422]